MLFLDWWQYRKLRKTSTPQELYSRFWAPIQLLHAISWINQPPLGKDGRPAASYDWVVRMGPAFLWTWFPFHADEAEELRKKYYYKFVFIKKKKKWRFFPNYKVKNHRKLQSLSFGPYRLAPFSCMINFEKKHWSCKLHSTVSSMIRSI